MMLMSKMTNQELSDELANKMLEPVKSESFFVHESTLTEKAIDYYYL